MTKHIVRNIAVILLNLGCVTKQQLAINIHLYEKIGVTPWKINLTYTIDSIMRFNGL